MKTRLLSALLILIFFQTALEAQTIGPLITKEVVVNDTCKNSSVTLKVESDNLPLTYLWSDGSKKSYLTKNTPGLYSVTITDKIGNSVTGGPYEIKDLPRSTYISNPDINGSCDSKEIGFIHFKPYSTGDIFYWSHDPNLHNGNADNLSAGMYAVTISDKTGICKLPEYSFEVHDNTIKVKNIEVGGISPCVNWPQTSGYLAIDLEFYYPPFPASLYADDPYIVTKDSKGKLYTWTEVSINGTTYINSLPQSGFLKFTIGSMDGCYIDTLIYIPLLDNLTSSLFTTYPDKENHIYDAFAQPKGGQKPYTYKWSDGSTDSSLKGLKTGKTYYVTVTDFYGCTSTTSSYIKNVKGNNEVHLINNGDNIEVRIDSDSGELIENGYSFSLVDIVGKTYSIQREKMTGQYWQMATAHLAPGIYYLIVRSDETLQSFSFPVVR